MRTDGLFTVREVKVQRRSRTESITVVPFGDIHRDSPAFCEDTWAAFRERCKGLKNVLYLGMGDYMDGYSTSEREIMYSKNLHDSSRERHEMEGKARIRGLAKELSFMKGKLIGLLGGNHFQRYANGTSGDNYLAEILGTRYLGACSAIRVMTECHGRGCSFDIFAHHGRGGGRTAAGRFNSVEAMAATADADIYLMGDNHARGAIPMTDRLRIMSHPTRGAYIRARRPWIGRTGSFLKAYEHGSSSYVVDAQLPPASLGWIEFEIAFNDRGSEPLEIEIKSRQ